jgi:hypothetical protein
MKNKPQKEELASKKRSSLKRKSSWKKKMIKPKKIKNDPKSAQIKMKKEACTFRK